MQVQSDRDSDELQQQQSHAHGNALCLKTIREGDSTRMC